MGSHRDGGWSRQSKWITREMDAGADSLALAPMKSGKAAGFSLQTSLTHPGNFKDVGSQGLLRASMLLPELLVYLS